MKVLASVLCTAVFASDRTRNLHLDQDTNTDVDCVSTALHRTSRRLSIFESIARSDGQRDDELSQSIENLHLDSESITETTDEILQQMRTSLGLEDSRRLQPPLPTTAPCTDSTVFESLLMMLSNPTTSDTPEPWQRYLMESIKKQQCSVNGRI